MLAAFEIKLIILLGLSILSLTKGEENSLQKKITGGYVKERDILAKFLVSIRKLPEKVFGDNALCGGTIIKPRVVVTAAHCFFTIGFEIPYQSYYVAAGLIRINETDRYTQIRYLTGYKIHPSYSWTEGNFGDVALMFLNESLYEDGIRVQRMKLIDVPPSSGWMCTVFGWGSTFGFSSGFIVTVFGGKKPEPSDTTDRVLYADVTILSNEECKSKRKQVEPDHFCVYDKKNNSQMACFGDSGGALVCQGNVQAGIVSYGFGCEDTLGLYTSIFYHRDWIEKESKGTALGAYSLICLAAKISVGLSLSLHF